MEDGDYWSPVTDSERVGRATWELHFSTEMWQCRVWLRSRDTTASAVKDTLHYFKIANITFRTLQSSQPVYLRSVLHTHHSTRSLRLSNTNLLCAPFVRTSFGSRSFSVAAPKIWNSPSGSSNVYQPWYLSPSTQDPLLPAGLPTHLVPLLLRLRFGSGIHIT